MPLQNKTKKIAFLAVFTSFAIVLSIVESMIPVPIPIPGVKLGLANVVSIMIIVLYGPFDAFTILTVRCLLGMIYSGNPISFALSYTGGILSIIIMFILYKSFGKYLSIWSISVTGAIFHNIGQIIAAIIIMKDFAIVSYLPVLLVSGIITGVLTGIASQNLLLRIKKYKFF